LNSRALLNSAPSRLFYENGMVMKKMVIRETALAYIVQDEARSMNSLAEKVVDKAPGTSQDVFSLYRVS
jgi:hypothetical protein